MLPPSQPLSIAVLISGGGTTLTNLLEHIERETLSAEISLVIASRGCAGVKKSQLAGLKTHLIPRTGYTSTAAFSQEVFQHCREAGVQLVVLGGFLSRLTIPSDFVDRVVNIHPSLIPAFCGEGMFGHHVHEAVLERGVKLSGCTVHFCDNEYDHGPIILQQAVPVFYDDTPDTLQARVFEAECEALPAAIQLIATGRCQVDGSRVQIAPY